MRAEVTDLGSGHTMSPMLDKLSRMSKVDVTDTDEGESRAPERRTGAMPDYESFRQAQRRQIAEHLIHTVATSGLISTNVTEVTKAAGISRKTFYKYFPSIQSALTYAQVVAIEGEGPRVGNLPEHASGLDDFMEIVENVAHSGLRQPERIRFISFFDAAIKHFQIDPVEREIYDSSLQARMSYLFTPFVRGQADGSIRPDLNLEVTATTCINSVMGLLQRICNIPDLYNRPEFAKAVMDTEIALWRERLSVH